MASSKTCFKCNRTLPKTAFYKHPMMADGLLGKCKKCTKTDTRINRRNHLEYYRAYDSDRAQQQHRKKLSTENTARNRKEIKGYQAAHSAVSRNIRNGKLVKLACQMCGSRQNVHAHHDDYSLPLDVMWLCAEHHKARHAFLDFMETKDDIS